MRPRISAAALFVKVTASTPSGETFSTWINHAMRCTRTRVLPLPAPAVCELLKDVPIQGVEAEMELVTPTGAALAVELAAMSVIADGWEFTSYS